MSNKRCPYCGSKKVEQTGKGLAEDAAKQVAYGLLEFAVSAFTNGRHGGGLSNGLSQNITSEYRCELCGKKFRYSDRDGARKK